MQSRICPLSLSLHLGHPLGSSPRNELSGPRPWNMVLAVTGPFPALRALRAFGPPLWRANALAVQTLGAHGGTPKTLALPRTL